MKKNKAIKQGIKTVKIIIGIAILVHIISKVIPMAILYYLGKS